MGRSRNGRRGGQNHAPAAEPQEDGSASASPPHQPFPVQGRRGHLREQQRRHKQQAEQQDSSSELAAEAVCAAVTSSPEAKEWVDAVPVPLSGWLGVLLARVVACLWPCTPAQPNGACFVILLVCLLAFSLHSRLALLEPPTVTAPDEPLLAADVLIVPLLLSQLLFVMWSLAVKSCVVVTSSVATCRLAAELNFVLGAPDEVNAAALCTRLTVLGRHSLAACFGGWKSLAWLPWSVLLSMLVAERVGAVQPAPEDVWKGLYAAYGVCALLGVFGGRQSEVEQWCRCMQLVEEPCDPGDLPPHAVFDSLNFAEGVPAAVAACCLHWLGLLWAWVMPRPVVVSRLLGFLVTTHLMSLPWQYPLIFSTWQQPSLRGWPLSALQQHLVLGVVQLLALHLLMLLWHHALPQAAERGDSTGDDVIWPGLWGVWMLLAANHALWILASSPALIAPSAAAGTIPSAVSRMALCWHYFFACLYLGMGTRWLPNTVFRVSGVIFWTRWDASHWLVGWWAVMWTWLLPFGVWLAGVSAGLQQVLPAYTLRFFSSGTASVELRLGLAACACSLVVLAATFMLLHVLLRPTPFLHRARCVLSHMVSVCYAVTPCWSHRASLLYSCMRRGTQQLWAWVVTRPAVARQLYAWLCASCFLHCARCVLRPVGALWRVALLLAGPSWQAWLAACSLWHRVLNYVFPCGAQSAPIVLASSRTASGTAAASSAAGHQATPELDPVGPTEANLKDATAAKADQEARQCTVCFDAARTVAFKPCGHICCCLACWDRLKQRRPAGKKRGGLPDCPLCHTEVYEVWTGIIIA